jgi:transcription initiation factor TFIIIB Brf1 subunit/transcription initiation factor TFIIB
MDQFTAPFIVNTSSNQICGLFIIFTLETCEENEGMFICQQCGSIFCEKCFDFTHRSEKKKLHEKKEMDENFVSQKCPKHENKRLELFCVKDEVKCCSLCLSDHISHVVVPITQAITLFRSEIQNKNFKEIYSKLETELKQIDKEIMTKKKELSELEVKKLLKVNHLESVQKISNSIKREEDFDKILEWRFFLEEKIESQFKMYACGDNSIGTIGLGEKIDKINKFTEIEKFRNKKIDLISCGDFSCFVYTGKCSFYSS